MQHNLIIITSVYPPDYCGVSDYTFNLMQTEVGKTWQLFYEKDWKLKKIFSIIKKINQLSAKTVNLQYPSMGFKHSIVPHLLCVYYAITKKKIFTVTIHEYSQFHLKGKIASALLYLFASKFIFTTQYEKDEVTKTFPRVISRSKIIKIRSNIHSVNILPEVLERKHDLGYFGFISPRKGLEQFLQTAETIKKTNYHYDIFIMGKIQPHHQEYAKETIDKANSLNISVILDSSEKYVAEILSQTKIMFLPFFDGISERRGSFLAAAESECVIVSTKGKFVTNSLKKCCELVDVDENAAEKIISLMNNNQELAEKQIQIKNYIKNEIPVSWNEIAEQYNNFLI